MKRHAYLLMLCLVLLLLPMNASAKSVWTVGYSVTLDGFSETAGLNPQEHLGVHFFIDPFGKQPLVPDLSAGILFPTASNGTNHLLYDIHIGIPLAAFDTHPISRILRRDSSLVPRIRFGILSGKGAQSGPVLSALAEPISLYYGDRFIRILGIRLTYRPEQQQFGWGVRLFEISHYLL